MSIVSSYDKAFDFSRGLFTPLLPLSRLSVVDISRPVGSDYYKTWPSSAPQTPARRSDRHAGGASETDGWSLWQRHNVTSTQGGPQSNGDVSAPLANRLGCIIRQGGSDRCLSGGVSAFSPGQDQGPFPFVLGRS